MLSIKDGDREFVGLVDKNTVCYGEDQRVSISQDAFISAKIKTAADVVSLVLIVTTVSPRQVIPHSHSMVTAPRLRLALLGLGRLGQIRARILAFQQPRIELVAVCDTKPGSDEWASKNLPSSVKFFANPEECMRNSGAEAVLISTATATHAPLICLALDLNLVSSFDFFRYLLLIRSSTLCVKNLSP